MPCADQYQFYSQLIDPDNGNLSTTKCHDLGANSPRRVYLTDSITLGFTPLCETNYSVSQLQWQFDIGAGWVNINPTAFPNNIPGIADYYAGGDGSTYLSLYGLKQSFDLRFVAGYVDNACSGHQRIILNNQCPAPEAVDGAYTITPYDSDGNGSLDKKSVAASLSIVGIPTAPGLYQWQADFGMGFNDLVDSATVVGSNGSSVAIYELPIGQAITLRLKTQYADIVPACINYFSPMNCPHGNTCQINLQSFSSSATKIQNNPIRGSHQEILSHKNGGGTRDVYISDTLSSSAVFSYNSCLTTGHIPDSTIWEWAPAGAGVWTQFTEGSYPFGDATLAYNVASATLLLADVSFTTAKKIRAKGYSSIHPSCFLYTPELILNPICQDGSSTPYYASLVTEDNYYHQALEPITPTLDVLLRDTISLSYPLVSVPSTLSSTQWQFFNVTSSAWEDLAESSYPFNDAAGPCFGTLAVNVTSTTLTLANVSFTTTEKIRSKAHNPAYPSCFVYSPEVILNPICQAGTFSSYYVSLTTQNNHYHNELVPIAQTVGGVEAFDTFLCGQINLTAVSYSPPAALDSIQWQFFNKTSNLWENLIEASFPFNDGINGCNGTQVFNTATTTLTLDTFSAINNTRTVRPVAFHSCQPGCQTVVGSEVNLVPKCPDIFIDVLYSYGIESGINYNHPIANPIAPTIGGFANRDFFRCQEVSFNYVPRGIPCSPTHHRWEWADLGFDNWQSFVDADFPFNDSIEFVCDGTRSINPTTPNLSLSPFSLLDTDPKKIRVAPYYQCHKTTPIPTCKDVYIVFSDDNCLTQVVERNLRVSTKFKISVPSTFNEVSLVGKFINYRQGLSVILSATTTVPPSMYPVYSTWRILNACSLVSNVILTDGDCSVVTAGCPPGMTVFNYVLPNCTPCYPAGGGGGAGGSAGQGGIGKSDCFVNSSEFFISGLCPEVKISNFYSSTIDAGECYLAKAIDHAPSQGSSFQRNIFFCSSVMVVSNPVGSACNPDTTIWQWAEINTNNWFDFVESEYPFGDNLGPCLGTQSNGVGGQALYLIPFSTSVPKKIRAKHNYACYPDCITYSSELRLDGICPPFTVVVVVNQATTYNSGGYFYRHTQKTATTTYSPVCAPDCYQWQKLVGGNWVNMVDQTIYDGTPPEQGGPLIVYSVWGATSATLTVNQMDTVGYPVVETYRVIASMCCSPQCSTTAP